MGTIIIRNKAYSFDTVKVQGDNLPHETNPFFASALKLARQWLRGDTEFVFQTSGSTGTPKKIMLRRGQLLASAQGTIDTLGLTSGEHILVCMNTQFIGGAMLLIRGLILNATITLQEPSGNPLQFIDPNHPYTFVSFAPLQLFPLLQDASGEKEKLNRFKHILIGGAAIDVALEQKLASLRAAVYHTYGMTETVSHIALRKIGKNAFYTILKGVFIKTDERNCLAVKSASTQNQWIQTNDVVTIINDTSFELHGRFDDLINSGGIKILPSTIERAIRECLGNRISAVLVTGITDPRLGQQIIAVIESGNDADDLRKDLDQKLPGLLGKYEIPKQFYVLRQFVYTPTGKISKPEILKMIGL